MTCNLLKDGIGSALWTNKLLVGLKKKKGKGNKNCSQNAKLYHWAIQDYIHAFIAKPYAENVLIND